MPLRGKQPSKRIPESKSKLAPRINSPPTADSQVHYGDDVVVNVGGTDVIVQSRRVTILCEVKGGTPVFITWMKDGKPIESDERLFGCDW